MTPKETKKIERPNKKEFVLWFAVRFLEISGKFIKPTAEELKEIAEESYKRLV